MSMIAEKFEYQTLPDEAKQIQDKALQVVPQATALRVVDEQTKELGGLLYNTINRALEQIGEVFNPMIEAAMEAKRKTETARKTIVTQKERFEAPWNEAKVYVVRQLTAYREEQDKKRKEEEERNRQVALRAEMERRKKAEEDAAVRAAEMEEAGCTEEAAQIVEEAIQEAEEPMRVYVAPPSTPKTEIKGGNFKVTWHAEVKNLKALCLAVGMGKASENLVRAYMPALNDLAIGMREQLTKMNIGVEAVRETNMAKARQ